MGIIATGNPHDLEGVNKFNEWIRSRSLIDTWRVMHYDVKDFTWSGKSRTNSYRARRLDHIFISENLLSKLTGSEHTIIGGADHKLVLSTFNTDNFVRGRSFWKFNASLLNDLDFLNETNAWIDNFISDYTDFIDPVDRFESFKVIAKSKCIEFSKKKSRESKNREEEIKLELKEINNKIVSQPQNHVFQQEMESKKKD